MLDPFAGSGTTLVAARALGLTAIGVEQQEDYCHVAGERLAQTALRLEPAFASPSLPGKE